MQEVCAGYRQNTCRAARLTCGAVQYSLKYNRLRLPCGVRINIYPLIGQGKYRLYLPEETGMKKGQIAVGIVTERQQGDTGGRQKTEPVTPAGILLPATAAHPFQRINY